MEVEVRLVNNEEKVLKLPEKLPFTVGQALDQVLNRVKGDIDVSGEQGDVLNQIDNLGEVKQEYHKKLLKELLDYADAEFTYEDLTYQSANQLFKLYEDQLAMRTVKK